MYNIPAITIQDWRNVMKRIVKSFFEGLILLVPIVLSVYVVYAVFVKVDGLLKLPVPGVGFLITVASITLIGFLASNILTRRLFNYVEDIMGKLPLVKILYSSIRDLIGAFVGEKKSFDMPVAVTVAPESGLKAIGFITRESLDTIGISDHVAVYFPQSYNFAGNLLICPKDQVAPLDLESSEVMKFLVSGGVSGGSLNDYQPL